MKAPKIALGENVRINKIDSEFNGRTAVVVYKLNRSIWKVALLVNGETTYEDFTSKELQVIA